MTAPPGPPRPSVSAEPGAGAPGPGQEEGRWGSGSKRRAVSTGLPRPPEALLLALHPTWTKKHREDWTGRCSRRGWLQLLTFWRDCVCSHQCLSPSQGATKVRWPHDSKGRRGVLLWSPGFS